MPDNSVNNKRIAKNTLMLYVRMLFTMVVSLYTSRVVLQTLGIEDYGIFSVVGGIIMMFTFINGGMISSTQRYLNFELATGSEEKLRNVFNTSLQIHALIALAIIILGETVGLWFLMEKLVIPEARMTAAHWVYQCSIISCAVSIMSSPYNADIIAHEKMSAFAFISIVDATLKLFIVYLLVLMPFDKLIVYSVLYFCVQAFIRMLYGVYCTRHFEETRTRPIYDHKVFKEILAFSGWTMNGNLAAIGYTQGLNILLNIFFGPVVNAARGIAVQAQGACMQFCNNFQVALNPQLTKSYAQGDLDYMRKLLVKSSKFSFYILFLIVLPLMFEAEFVLRMWLGIVPDHTVVFLRLILIIGIFNTLSGPIIVSIHAIGKLKKFHVVEGVMLLSIVPIAYLLLKYCDVAPECVFIVHIIVELFTQYARLRMVLPMINMPLDFYVKQVIRPIVIVMIFSSSIPFLLYANGFTNEGWISFILTTIICAICTLISVYFIGCTLPERKFFIGRIKNSIPKSISIN